MSVVSEMHCWDVLVTAAEACCVQLLYDANDSVYVAVGSTLNSLYELERILLTLCAGIMSCRVTDKPQIDTAAVHSLDDNPVSSSSSAAAAAAVDCTAVNPASLTQMSVMLDSDGKCNDLTSVTESCSLTADNEQQLNTSSQVSAARDTQVSAACETVEKASTNSQQVSIDSNDKRSHVNQQFTRSGRAVKSKNLADFMSSNSLQSGSSANKTDHVKRRRGRPCKTPVITSCQHKPAATVSCSDNVEDCNVVKDSLINQQLNSSDTLSTQQHVDGCRETAACDTASHITTAIGKCSFCFSIGSFSCRASDECARLLGDAHVIVSTCQITLRQKISL